MDKNIQLALQILDDDLNFLDTSGDGETEIKLQTQDIERFVNDDDKTAAQWADSTSTLSKGLVSNVKIQEESNSYAHPEILADSPFTRQNFEQVLQINEVETMQFYAEVATTRATNNHELDLNNHQHEIRNDNEPLNAPFPPTIIPKVRARSEEPSTSQQSLRAIQFQLIRRNSTSSQPNGNQHDTGSRLLDKFGKGVQSNMEGGNSLAESEMADESLSNSTPEPDPWHCIVQLSKKGYGISFEIFKLRRQFMENGNLKWRKYQCKVTLGDTTGICEAFTENVAKAGAAVDFFTKFTTQISNCQLTMLSPLPTVLDGVSKITNMSKAFEILKERIREKYNKELTYRFQTITAKMCDKYGHSHSHTVRLWINQVKYEGRSVSSYMRAKTAAILTAYESIFQEQFPFDPIYLGQVECTGGAYMFKLECAQPYCYDFTRADLVEPFTVEIKMVLLDGIRAATTSSMKRAGKESHQVILSFFNPKSVSSINQLR